MYTYKTKKYRNGEIMAYIFFPLVTQSFEFTIWFLFTQSAVELPHDNLNIHQAYICHLAVMFESSGIPLFV